MPLLLPIVWLAVGCASDRRVAEGRFLKRVHRPGWHVDLGRATAPQAPHGTHRAAPRPASATKPPLPVIIALPAEAVAEAHAVPPATWSAPQGAAAPAVRPTHAYAPTTAPPQEVDDHAGDRPRGPVNKLGIAALALVAGGIVAAFVGNSALLVALVVAAGIVLAAIALRRIRALEQRGKGFALTALVLGMAAALLTLMMIVRSGW
jgi:hypothetical protein